MAEGKYAEKEIVVVGYGDNYFETAEFLVKQGDAVTIIERADRLAFSIFHQRMGRGVFSD